MKIPSLFLKWLRRQWVAHFTDAPVWRAYEFDDIHHSDQVHLYPPASYADACKYIGFRPYCGISIDEKELTKYLNDED